MRRVPAIALLSSSILIGSCATSRTAAPPSVTPEQARLAWEAFRGRARELGRVELLFDASVTRRGDTVSGTISVADDPGRALTLQAEGPFGIRMARGVWEEGRVVVETFGHKSRKVESDPERFGEAFGVPLSARELSWIFVGLPDDADPDDIAVSEGIARLTWGQGRLLADFDLSRGLVVRIVARGSRQVEVRYRDWRGDVPAAIAARVTSGESAELVLRSVEASPR
jgi:outer membrane biogenesis lipoprotein LolB